MQISEVVNLKEGTLCYHCGDVCNKSLDIQSGDKVFCCTGCKTVYEILQENNLCKYYDMDNSPGISQKKLENVRFVESAPKELVDKERKKLEDGLTRLAALEESLSLLVGKQ